MGRDAICPCEDDAFAVQQLSVMRHGHVWLRFVPQTAYVCTRLSGALFCIALLLRCAEL